MSRLADPFARLLSRNRFLRPQEDEVRVSDILPQVAPEEERSLIGRLQENTLGGLSYLGDVADKTFGGRAVRGVLGGNFDEALSVLPFSDTLGLTDPTRTVRGRDLVAPFFGADDPSSLDLGDAAGFAAEVLLDPSTYFGIGGLTKGAKAAAKLGATQLPRTLGQRLRPFDLAESSLRPLLQPGQELSDVARRLLPDTASPTILSQAAEDAARAAGSPLTPRYGLDAAGGLAEQQGSPLAGLLSFKVPFVGERQPLLEGVTAPLDAANFLYDNRLTRATGVKGLADRVNSRVLSPVGRTLNAVFDPSVLGASTAEVQSVARDVTSPLKTRLEREALGQRADIESALAPLLKGQDPDAARAAGRLVTAQAEDKLGDILPPALADAGKFFRPDELQTIQGVGTQLTDFYGKNFDYLSGLGVRSPELADPTANYALRQAAVLPKQAGETAGRYRDRLSNVSTATHQSQLARADELTGVPGGTNAVNDLFRNPALSGADRVTPQPQRFNALSDILFPNGGLQKLEQSASADKLLTSQAFDKAIQTGLPDDLRLAQSLEQDAARSAAELKAASDKVEALDRRLGVADPAYAKGADFFTTDPTSLAYTAGQRTKRAATAAETAHEALARYSKPLGEYKLAGREEVSAADFLKEMQLAEKTGDAYPGLQKAAARIGVDANELKNVSIPRDVADDILRLGQPAKVPAALKPVTGAFNYLTNLFKANVTVPYPAFHTRNVADAAVNALRDDAFSVSAGKDAYNFLRGTGELRPLPGMPAGASQKEIRDQVYRELSQARALGAGQSDDVAGPAGDILFRAGKIPEASKNSLLRDALPGKPASLNPLNVRGASVPRGEKSTFGPVAYGERIGQGLDDFTRTAHYLAKRQAGFSPEAAAEGVLKYQRDYSNISDIEKNYLRPFAPFYSFSKSNLGPVLSDLVTQPGKITGPLRATSQVRTPGEFVPDYIAEGASVPVPGAPDGQQRYLSSFGLPIEDEAIKTIGSLLHGDLQRAGQQLVGQAVPQIKAPFEYLSGRQLFSGRPLEDLKPYEFASLGGLLNPQQARAATQVLGNTPASRALSSLNKILDTDLIGGRKDVGTQAANFLTGVRFSDVDAARAQDAVARQRIEQELAGRPGVRTAVDVYLPRTQLDQVSPQDALLYKLYLNAEQRIRERAKSH